MKCHACGAASDRAEARCPTCGSPLAVAGGRYVLREVLGAGQLLGLANSALGAPGQEKLAHARVSLRPSLPGE
jgi:ribosomal protein S14